MCLPNSFAKSTKKGTLAVRETWAAVPIIEQGILLGALQVTRTQGPEFRQAELDLLERLAGAVAVSQSPHTALPWNASGSTS